jgi:hypothetical protein
MICFQRLSSAEETKIKVSPRLDAAKVEQFDVKVGVKKGLRNLQGCHNFLYTTSTTTSDTLLSRIEAVNLPHLLINSFFKALFVSFCFNQLNRTTFVSGQLFFLKS